MYNHNFPATERLAQVRMKDVEREARHAWLIREAKGPRKVREWRVPWTLLVGSLLALVLRLKGL